MKNKFIILISIFLLIFVLGQQIVKSKTPANILIILDSSYSMEDKVGFQRKIDVAKNTINNVLDKLSPDINLGLRVYGHKSGFLGFGGCKASELKVPISRGSKSIIQKETSKIEPVGVTPITFSLKQALEQDFDGINGTKRIILLSDGMENCDSSPCDYAVELARNNIDLKIDVIGFDLNEPDAVSQLKCVALATKGRFFTARNPEELADSLSKSFNISKEVQGVIVK